MPENRFKMQQSKVKASQNAVDTSFKGRDWNPTYCIFSKNTERLGPILHQIQKKLLD